MTFWIREVAGWLLVLLGLLVFYLCLGMLFAEPVPRILEVGPATLIGIILFRGGIHLLKIAVAARICLAAQQRLAADSSAAATLPMRRRASRFGSVNPLPNAAVATPS